MTSSREDFNESWLNEMPSGIGKMGHGIFDALVYSIRDLESHGKEPNIMSEGFRKIFSEQIAYYWHEDQHGIDIAVELTIKPQALIVSGLGRRAVGSSVHATDLYNAILKDNHKSIKLMSDEQLSDAGLLVWKRLLNMGHKITVYDNNDPGSTMQTLKSESEMEQFYQKASKEHRRWQYVLSESGEKLAETRNYFNTYRMRQLAGLDTE